MHVPAAPAPYHARSLARSGAREGRLHVLFVTPYLPSPPRFGGQARMHGLMTELSRTHDVSVLSLVDASEDQTEAVRATRSYCRHVATVPSARQGANGAFKRALQLRSLLSPHSHGWLAHRDRGLEASLVRLIADERHDLVQFEFSQMAACRPEQRALGANGPAFCLDEHNIEHEIARRTASQATGVLRKAYSAVDWRKLRLEERRAWTAFDGCTLPSDRDERALHEALPAARTAVVPNGVDLDHFQTSDGVERVPMTLLFFGAIDYYPNTEGLLFFLREVMPLLVARHPALRLTIVGRRPPPAISAWRSARVEITGVVDDVRPFLASASAVVVPLRIGGGTRLKVLEAMAMRAPVVSTSLGVEGLEVVPERDVLVADDAPGLARQIGRVLADPALAARLGQRGRHVVDERYGWRASVERLVAFYAELLAARGAT